MNFNKQRNGTGNKYNNNYNSYNNYNNYSNKNYDFSTEYDSIPQNNNYNEPFRCK